MHAFETGRLSPLPKTSAARGLPYGLTWDDLKTSLPGFYVPAAEQAQALDTYEKQGLNGGSNSCILTLRYPSEKGPFRSETVFVKRVEDPRRREGQKYRYLAAQGIPTPRLIAKIDKVEAEIILLEFLPAIGIDFHSDREVAALLQLAAQVNALATPPEFLRPAPGIPQAEYDETVREVLTALASEPVILGGTLKMDAARWFAAYQTAQAACQALPTALNHNQFFFQQVGWAQRGSTRQLVIFDLETMALAPRFFDIATILKPLAEYTCRGQGELFQIYFEQMRALGRLDMDSADAFQELTLVRALDLFYSLPWYFEARNTDISGETIPTPAAALREIQQGLTSLMIL